MALYNSVATAQAIAKGVAGGRRDFGRVRLVQDGDLFLLNYTDKATHGGKMTRVEMACRGLLVSGDGRVAALPMPKFFNIGELQCPAVPENAPYEIYDKVDGSLGIFWWDWWQGQWRCTTRGSFSSEYTEFGKWWWDKYVDHRTIPHRCTVMAEICIDADVNQRAAYYKEGLWFVAARDLYSGADVRPLGMLTYGMFRASDWGSLTIGEILKRKDEEEGREGWVVRFKDGLRMKVKTAWYLRLFRAVHNLDRKHVKALALASRDGWLDEFPDDLRPAAAEIWADIEVELRATLCKIYRVYSELASIESRKDFAMEAKKYPEIQGWLFNLRDDKFDEDDVLRKML